VITFADSSGLAWTAATILTVSNWAGSIQGSGNDQLVFSKTNSGLTAGQLSQIRFTNPFGFSAGIYTASMLASGEVVPAATPPVITLQPTNRIAAVGDTIAFNVGATAVPPPAFQWKHEGTNLPGQTTSTLTLAGVTIADGGNYFVTVTNVAGSTNSATATLTVNPASGPTLSPVTYSPDGFSFGVTGAAGFKFVIQSSTNLQDWNFLQTNVSPFVFSDTNVDIGPIRFYRAQYIP
jgi:hypothetical protein